MPSPTAVVDQEVLVLDGQAWDEFVVQLSAPARPDARLVELFARPRRITR